MAPRDRDAGKAPDGAKASSSASLAGLIDALWPCPEPPADLAQRVLERMNDEAAGPPSRAGSPNPVPGHGVGATHVTGAAATGGNQLLRLAVAATLVLVAIGGSFSLLRALDDEAEEAGPMEAALVASTRQTVQIGSRAAAAMDPGAEVAWSVRGKSARVRQRRGSVFYRVDKGGPFEVATPGGQVQVTGTCFRVTVGREGAAKFGTSRASRVTVLEGSVNVRTSAGSLRLAVGQTGLLQEGRPPRLVQEPASDAPPDSVDDASADLRARALRAEEKLRALEAQRANTGPAEQPQPPRTPPEPERAHRPAGLLLPWSSRLRIYRQGRDPLQEVSLALPPIPKGRAPSVEVAHDPAFERPIFRGRVRERFVTVPAPARGDLYWRVTDGRGRMAHARFLPDTSHALLALDSPSTVVSDRRPRTTIHFQGAPPPLTLSFSSAPRASAYRVRIHQQDTPERPILDQVVDQPRYAIESGLLVEGVYLWTADALDREGREMTRARPSVLELLYDNALRTLVLAEPGPDQLLTGASVTVRGVAPLGARLTVNGRPLALDEKGRFATRLAGKPRTLTFRLIDPQGGQSYWLRELRYSDR